MSKHVKDILQEFEFQTDIEEDFQLHVLKVKVDDAGEVEPVGNAEPVTNIEIDSDNKECLLHFDGSTSESVTVSEARSILVDAVLDFEICASEEKETDDAVVRLDTPLIGFGENVEIKVFFVICQA